MSKSEFDIAWIVFLKNNKKIQNKIEKRVSNQLEK
jgi:hypothetical protein